MPRTTKAGASSPIPPPSSNPSINPSLRKSIELVEEFIANNPDWLGAGTHTFSKTPSADAKKAYKVARKNL